MSSPSHQALPVSAPGTLLPTLPHLHFSQDNYSQGLSNVPGTRMSYTDLHDADGQSPSVHRSSRNTYISGQNHTNVPMYHPTCNRPDTTRRLTSRHSMYDYLPYLRFVHSEYPQPSEASHTPAGSPRRFLILSSVHLLRNTTHAYCRTLFAHSTSHAATMPGHSQNLLFPCCTAQLRISQRNQRLDDPRQRRISSHL